MFVNNELAMLLAQDSLEPIVTKFVAKGLFGGGRAGSPEFPKGSPFFNNRIFKLCVSFLHLLAKIIASCISNTTAEPFIRHLKWRGKS